MMDMDLQHGDHSLSLNLCAVGSELYYIHLSMLIAKDETRSKDYTLDYQPLLFVESNTSRSATYQHMAAPSIPTRNVALWENSC